MQKINYSKISGQFLELHKFKNFHSTHLSNKRDLIVYLPPHYRWEQQRSFPVLYMQDGQNLFEPETSYIAGNYWRVGETAQTMIEANKIEPMIIVGIYNTGLHRIIEYTPTKDSHHKQGGQAEAYGRFLVDEVKPFIEGRYRTLAGPENTALGGSSLGGLVTLYLGLRYPHIFGKLAVISPSIWWDNGVMLHYIQQLASKPKLQMWLDMGTRESKHGISDVRGLRDLLLVKGWQLNKDLKYYEARGGKHDEITWAKRMPMILKYLFEKKPIKKTSKKSSKKPSS